MCDWCRKTLACGRRSWENGSGVGTARANVRRSRWAAASGPLAGAFALAILFGLDFVGATLEVMGFSDEKAYSLIIHRYGWQIARDQLEENR